MKPETRKKVWKVVATVLLLPGNVLAAALLAGFAAVAVIAIVAAGCLRPVFESFGKNGSAPTVAGRTVGGAEGDAVLPEEVSADDSAAKKVWIQ